MTLNRQHFTNTKRCGTALSFSPLHAAPPPNAHTHTRAHTHDTCLPLSYLCISWKAYGYRHPIPSVESSLSLYRSSQRGQTMANRNIVWDLSFCAEAVRCGQHKNSRKERRSLIKLHLVKQTSLHSSCQSGRIYVAVNKEWYLRELTETNLEHGWPYIIHSAPCPCTQLRFPDAPQTAAVLEPQLWDFLSKSQLMKNLGSWASFLFHNREGQPWKCR